MNAYNGGEVKNKNKVFIISYVIVKILDGHHCILYSNTGKK